MLLLLIGVMLWSATHFIPSLAPGLRSGLQSRLGAGPYKGLFSLSLLLAIGLIVWGWRSASVEQVYQPPQLLYPWALGLMLVAWYFMAAASLHSRLKQVIRHPQLCGLVLWAIAHLLLNGDSRSLVLFVGLGLWASIQIQLINRREASWNKPVLPPWSADIKALLISIVVFMLLIFLHPYIAGRPVF